MILGAFSFDQILRARMQFPEQKYLLQATVTPRTIQGRPAWFRVFYSVGKTYPCWWHPLTHVFASVTPSEENKYELKPLHDIDRPRTPSANWTGSPTEMSPDSTRTLSSWTTSTTRSTPRPIQGRGWGPR
ncbi:MAG: hypothetical protein MZV64_59470 [Ignavibacteriales bacterium]|nr:hypothetical protein [Ignavibacteriales bacterium]